MRRLLILPFLLAPLGAWASDACRYEAPRNLQVDLAGVRGVQIEVGSQDLHLGGSTTARQLELTGRACSSDKSMLDNLQVTQRREGDQLLLDITGGEHMSFSLFGGSSSSIEVTVQLPANLPVTVRVGSGDAEVHDVQQLKSSVGSGDLHVRAVTGVFATSVGSGDVDASGVGGLDLGSVGSGDAKIEGVSGDARIGSIGSGDVVLRKVSGSVRAETLGSGDLTVSDVAGDFTLAAKGSGDVNHSGIKGKVSVPKDDD